MQAENLNPGRSLPEFITALTGIADCDVADVPRLEEIASELADLPGGAVFAAHNACFDYGFVRNDFKRMGVSFPAPRLQESTSFTGKSCPLH